MKKTIVALLALAGLASADTTISDLISSATYNEGDSYTLTFKITSGITGGHDVILNLTDFTTSSGTEDGWTLNTEIGQYVGFSVNSTNGIAGNYGDLTSSTRKNPFISTIDVGAEGWVYDSGKNSLVDVVVTLSYNGGDTTSLTLVKDNSATSTADVTWVDATITSALDLKGISVGGAVKSYSNASLVVTPAAVPTPPVPEPTTATLSLLALAGLAARRRRK